MRAKSVHLIVLAWALAFVAKAALAQEPAPIPLSSEPHHHLALHNDFVNVYEVEVPAHDTVRLHRHDSDAISLMLSDAVVTVHSPGKPDVQSKLGNGQIRLQRSGYVHSTTIDSDTVYRNVTVELLKPQTSAHNVCGQVIPREPLNCPQRSKTSELAADAQPEFATNQTEIDLVHVAPGANVALGQPGRLLLIVALDPGLTLAPGTELAHALRPAGFIWTPDPGAKENFRNTGSTSVRVVVFVFKANAES